MSSNYLNHSQNNLNNPKLCKYCKAELNPAYYFCLSCATPYKDMASVVPTIEYSEKSVQVDKEFNLKRKAYNFFWSYTLVIFILSLFQFVLIPSNSIEINLIIITIGIAIYTIYISIMYWETLILPLKNLGLFNINFLYSLLILSGLLVVNYFYNNFISELIGEDSFIDSINDIKWSRLISVLVICVAPAITEEIAFRGILQRWFLTVFKPYQAIAVTSLLFSAIHLSILGLPYLFLVGFLLGWISWKNNSLYPAMILHFLHNYVVITYF